MIRKITSNEYLKRIDNMSLSERDEYLKRVGEWLCRQAPMIAARRKGDMARFQNAIHASAGWNDEECTAWSDGVQLLSALIAVSDTWLPEMLYTKAVRRTVKQMISLLRSVASGNSFTAPSPDTEKRDTESRPPIYSENVAPKKNDTRITSGEKKPAEKTPKEKQGALMHPLSSGCKVLPQRPKHIDQYVHLLPKQTQEKAATVKGLLRELDVARENARILMDAGEHADKRAQWAKTASKLDEKLRSIYCELDAGWSELAEKGVVTVDAFGNVEIHSEARKENDSTATEELPPASQDELRTKKHGRPPMTEEEKSAKKAEREEKKRLENQRKAALLRKFLIDKRNAKTEAQEKKWLEKYREMVRLGGEDAVTEKVREAAEYYGIELVKE